MLVLRLRHRDTGAQRTRLLDAQLYTLTEVTRLLDSAIATTSEVSLMLDNGELFPLNPRMYDVIAVVEPQAR